VALRCAVAAIGVESQHNIPSKALIILSFLVNWSNRQTDYVLTHDAVMGAAESHPARALKDLDCTQEVAQKEAEEQERCKLEAA
jgi:hypothetical protein